MAINIKKIRSTNDGQLHDIEVSYTNVTSKPKINGIQLTGETSLTELSAANITDVAVLVNNINIVSSAIYQTDGLSAKVITNTDNINIVSGAIYQADGLSAKVTANTDNINIVSSDIHDETTGLSAKVTTNTDNINIVSSDIHDETTGLIKKINNISNDIYTVDTGLSAKVLINTDNIDIISGDVYDTTSGLAKKENSVIPTSAVLTEATGGNYNWTPINKIEYLTLTAGQIVNILITTSTCKLGDIFTLRINNNAGGSILYGSNAIISTTDTGKYLISFANLANEVDLIGEKVEVK